MNRNQQNKDDLYHRLESTRLRRKLNAMCGSLGLPSLCLSNHHRTGRCSGQSGLLTFRHAHFTVGIIPVSSTPASLGGAMSSTCYNYTEQKNEPCVPVHMVQILNRLLRDIRAAEYTYNAPSLKDVCDQLRVGRGNDPIPFSNDRTTFLSSGSNRIYPTKFTTRIRLDGCGSGKIRNAVDK